MLEINMTRAQMNLRFLNYYFGAIDGIKGKQTISAIKEFRYNNGLSESEYIDQEMIDVMRDIICRIQSIVGASVDGVAGNETIELTKKWQSDHGLVSDGICGTITREAMFNQKPVPSEDWNFPHFKKSEFACPCCGFDSINYNLVSLLEEIRSHFGGNPLHITSGCRCAKHNAEVGGVQGSRHVIGKASDFYISGVSTSNLLNYCRSLVNQGRARYTYTNSSNMNGVVHIDII